MPLTANILKEHTNPVFIETGTGAGAGIQTALDAGFRDVVSVEIDFDRAQTAKEKFGFAHNGVGVSAKVSIWHGCSATVLPEVLSELDRPATFWLDAAKGKKQAQELFEGADPCPILAEIEAIAAHHIKTHTLLIDMVESYEKGLAIWGGTNLVTIKALLAELLPNHKTAIIVGSRGLKILTVTPPEGPAYNTCGVTDNGSMDPPDNDTTDNETIDIPEQS